MAVAKPVATPQAAASPFTLHFDVNARNPNDEAGTELDAVAALLTSNPALHVNIDGHSDRNGTANYNDQLSRARADAVAEALMRRGIARSRIVTLGHGARAPVDKGTDLESFARNRRVEVRIEGRKP
ncbi:OmpA family protein [Pendulispora albinea]|uniref:OmpA family protein n=1 Tax=Pendulispora albinea TaxID=2741071 RepID=A0ABZ2MCV6_9BACT